MTHRRATTQRLTLVVSAALTVSAVLAAPVATADLTSYYDALHAQGITSTAGDQALFDAGTAVCKNTALYIRTGGDWGFFGARRKAAENLVLDNLQRPRTDTIILANTAIRPFVPAVQVHLGRGVRPRGFEPAQSVHAWPSLQWPWPGNAENQDIDAGRKQS